MKRGIYLYLEIELIKEAQKKDFNISLICNDALRIAVRNPPSDLKAGNPEKSLLGTWLRLPYKYRKKATIIFMNKHKGLLPNFDKLKHTEELLKIYSKIAKQTKISLKTKEGT